VKSTPRRRGVLAGAMKSSHERHRTHGQPGEEALHLLALQMSEAVLARDSRFFQGSLLDLPADRISKLLESDGLILFEDRAITRHDLADWQAAILEALPHPDADNDGLTEITPNGRHVEHSSGRGFTERPLTFHVDGAGEPTPPSITVVLALQASATGGESILADGRSAMRRVLDEGVATAVGALRIPILLGGSKHFLLNSQECSPSRYFIRYREDSLLKADGRESAETLRAFARRLRDGQTTIGLRSGQGYVIHNHRWLHGRSAFLGERRMVRLLARLRTPQNLDTINQGFRW
jgi:alpha-ketoglutarate-dependent taurine dioxygenase